MTRVLGKVLVKYAEMEGQVPDFGLGEILNIV